MHEQKNNVKRMKTHSKHKKGENKPYCQLHNREHGENDLYL